MTIQDLSEQYIRDLDRLANEMKLYNNEELVWQKTGKVNNSAGNLCWHITGNLQHFIGHILGGSGYQRDREYEFNARNIEMEEMLVEIDRTKNSVRSGLASISEERLTERYPIDVLGHEMTVGFFLLHLLGHLNYHLGQISYHRRLLDV